MTKYRVIVPDGLNVRVATSTAAARIGALPGGSIFDADATAPDAFGNVWHALAVTAGGVPLAQRAYAAHAYQGTGLTEIVGGTVTPPPPPTTTPARFWSGLNFPSGGLDIAKQAAWDGCRMFLVIDDFMGAGQVQEANPNAIVMARRTGFTRGLTADQLYAALENAGNPNLMYVGINEGDQESQDGEDLRWRLIRDVRVAKKIRANSGARYAAGSFSVGQPNFNSAADCQIIREELAPAYNAGLIWLDLHPYSPTPDHIYGDDDLIWYERRWEQFFTKCGLDPSVRHVVFSECGQDVPRKGGFVNTNTTEDQFRLHFKRHRLIQERDIVVNGVSYTSPVIGGAYFQCRSAYWAGFEMITFIPVMKAEGW